MDIVFEKTNFEYYPQFLRICRENMQTYCKKFLGGWSDSKNEQNFKDFLSSRGVCYSISSNSKIIGYFCIIVKSDVLFINDLQIDKKYHNKGIGSQSLYFIEKLANDWKLSKLELKVFNVNPAKKLYLRFGFNEIQNEFNGNGVLMRKSF